MVMMGYAQKRGQVSSREQRSESTEQVAEGRGQRAEGTTNTGK
jgi:hypothetical protein